MRASVEQLRAIAARAVRATNADEAEAVVLGASTALTRFAGNRIHQNMVENDTVISIRAVIGGATGVAVTNRLDADSIRRCAARASDATRHVPEDPDFPGLPDAHVGRRVDRSVSATRDFDEVQRAEAARQIIEQSSARGLVAAGSVAVRDAGVAVANSRGVDVAAETAELHATVLSTGPGGGSGWASLTTANARELAPAALGARAARTAEHSVDGRTLDPGTYTVVLGPEAVAEVVSFLGYLGFGAKAYVEGSSLLAGHVGERIVDARISLHDDALSPAMVGLPFDYEGQPKCRAPLIEGGVARGPVTDSYYAHLAGLPNTGHALPAPNPHGPMPLNLVLAAGTWSVEQMIASVKRGVYVSRFHYVNVEDPMKVVLTGMTRDGTFLVEDGRLSVPLRNLRFTQGVLEALNHVGAVGSDRLLVGSPGSGAVLVPALLLEEWAFTGQTR